MPSIYQVLFGQEPILCRPLGPWQRTEKPQIVVLNKMDLPGTDQMAKMFQTAFKDREVFLISAVTRKGIEQLISNVVELLDQFDEGKP